jgi:hypothetical protein
MCVSIVGVVVTMVLSNAAAETRPPPFRITSYEQAVGRLQLDADALTREPLKIGSTTYDKGLGTHALSRINVELRDGCLEFRADIGVQNAPRARNGRVIFRIDADGEERFRSETLRHGAQAVGVEVDLRGVKALRLVADFPGANTRECMADWADARIVMADGTTHFLSDVFRTQGLPEPRSPFLGFGPTPEPETRTLPDAEADAVLVQDWLFQAGNSPTHARIRDEIKWTREVADRVLRDGARVAGVEKELRRLATLEQQLPAPPPPPPSAGPVLPDLLTRWTFEPAPGTQTHATVRDLSLPPDSGVRPAEGVFGTAGRFSGNIVEADIERGVFGRGAYTICAWIRLTRGEADIMGSGIGAGHVLFMVFRGVLRAHHWTDAGSNVLDGKTPVNDGRWHHVAQVVDGRRVGVYVDGQLDGEGRFAGKPRAVPDPFALGARSLSRSGPRFVGDMDELALYGRALPQAELQQLFEAAPARQDDTVLEQADAELYLAVRRIKRRIMLHDTAIDFSSLVFIDVPFAGKNGIVQHETNHRNGYYNRDEGGRLLRLDGLHPGAPVTKLAMPEPGTFLRPDLSYDGRTVLFSFKPGTEEVFHLYEIGVDGAGLRQLTHGLYDDLDPTYMPAGHITFVTARCNTYPRCASPWYSSVLARCDREGRNIYFISAGNEPDYTPAVLPDGRILYTRWEYTDKEVMRIQSLWTVNPDGTFTSAFWGNQSVWPDMLVEARPIPGSHRIMFAGLGHHDVYRGSIGIIDQRKGLNYPDGLTKVTPDVPWAEVGDGPAECPERKDYHAAGEFGAYKSPYPLSETLFLVSARDGDSRRMTNSDPEASTFRLYLMDVCGNRELLYKGGYNVLYALPVRSRPLPRIIPDAVAWPGPEHGGGTVKPGVFYSGNVYQGTPPAIHGKARYVRVLSTDPVTYSMGFRAQSPDHRGIMPHSHGSPSTSITQSDGIKRILGTATIAADGSFHFTVPPCKAMFFQVLDENYRALQTMRSFANVMPGEKRGCVGCHEMHSVAPAITLGYALKQPPAELTPPPWGVETSVGYHRFVQPVLDRYCGTCHQGDGKARKKLDLTRRPGKGNYCEPYLTLVLGPGANLDSAYVGNAKGGIAGTIVPTSLPHPVRNGTVPPMTKLSYTSPLIRIASSGEHHGVKVDALSLRKLIAWVDALCPYLDGIDVRNMRDSDPEMFSHMPYPPRIKTAPTVNRAYCQDEFDSQAARLSQIGGKE